MKKIYKLLILTIALTGSLFYSCETIELENLASPNALSADQADPALLFNRIQMEYLGSVQSINGLGGQLSRAEYLGDEDYFNYAGSAALNFAWGNFYADMLPDIQALKDINDANPDLDLSTNVAVAEIMQAHLMTLLVDYLGDIIFSEATNPGQFPNPNLDDDEMVYMEAMSLLDNALVLLGADAPLVGQDLFGGPDWSKVANTIKMRINLNTGNYAAVVNASNVIESDADDFAFPYGTNVQQPDNRHPDYINDYRDDGANTYRSNWLMYEMTGTYGDFFEDDDPRRRYYFYRQNAITPGNISLLRRDTDGAFFILSEDENVEALECSGNAIFPHLAFTPEEEYWCSVKMGYWGRDHLNNEGIPPDGSLRTVSGVYPAGGSFDGFNDYLTWDGGGDFNFVGYEQASVFLGKGGGGAGIEPIYLSSYVSFMKAIAALLDDDAGTASMYLEMGLTQSIAKVQSFASVDPDADLTNAPSAARVSDFIANTVAEFDAAPMTSGVDSNGFPVEKDKLDILGEQYFRALYGGGADLFNFIRYTGYPRAIPRGWEPNRGAFPRTFLYPNSEASTNPNVIQRTDNSDTVFWDSGITNPAN